MQYKYKAPVETGAVKNTLILINHIKHTKSPGRNRGPLCSWYLNERKKRNNKTKARIYTGPVFALGFNGYQPLTLQI